MQNVPDKKIIEFTDVYNVMVDGKIITTKIKKLYINNVLRKETYINDNFKEHRDANSYGGEGPAIIVYRKDGKTPVLESWLINGKSYRDDDLPTTVEYNKEGKVITHLWFVDTSKLHRDPAKGPAKINYVNGNIYDVEYHVDGKRYEHPKVTLLHGMINGLNEEGLDKCINFINSWNK